MYNILWYEIVKQKTAASFYRLRRDGSGIRIRTLNNGVRVRCVTVTLYRCIVNAPYYTIKKRIAQE